MLSGAQAYEVDISDAQYLVHDNTPLLARVFRPKGTGPFPIVVELHGGAWVRGDRQNGDAANESLCRDGLIVVALDFRAPPLASYPGSLIDIHYGIRWCKTRALEWNGIPNRIATMGTSSGAHLAMLIGMRPHDPRYSALPLTTKGPGVDGAVDAVILCSPVIDPLGRYHYAKGLRDDCTPPPGIAERVVLMHDQYWKTEEAMAEAAPARILARGERASLPPVLLLAHSQEDAHPKPDREEFVRQYRKAGGKISENIFEGEGGLLAGGATKGLSLREPFSLVAKEALMQMTSFVQEHVR